VGRGLQLLHHVVREVEADGRVVQQVEAEAQRLEQLLPRLGGLDGLRWVLRAQLLLEQRQGPIGATPPTPKKYDAFLTKSTPNQPDPSNKGPKGAFRAKKGRKSD
jgi:hypothetical protein